MVKEAGQTTRKTPGHTGDAATALSGARLERTAVARTASVTT